jgi:hypothetical protein
LNQLNRPRSLHQETARMCQEGTICQASIHQWRGLKVTEGHQAEELKDSIIDLVLSAPQREEVWKEACLDARKHHEE